MKNVLRKIINVLLIIVLLFAVFLFIVKFTGTANKSNFPVHLYEIITGSMEPTLKARSTYSNGKKKTGDVVLVFRKNVDKLKEGDIIAYYTDIDYDGKYDIVTHRIVKIENGSYEIKGDAAGSLDETLTYMQMKDRIIGKIAFNNKLFFVSILYRFISTVYGFLILVVIPLGFLIVKEVITLVKTINEEKEDSEDEGITVNYGGKKFSEEEIKQMITEKEGNQDEKE